MSSFYSSTVLAAIPGLSLATKQKYKLDIKQKAGSTETSFANLSSYNSIKAKPNGLEEQFHWPRQALSISAKSRKRRQAFLRHI